MEAHDAQQPVTPGQLKVRQVTHYQLTWSENAPGADGVFTLQLILDQGAEEYVLRPTAEDTEVLQSLLKKTDTLFFDLDRKVLMFGTNPVGSA